jgi:hypothetical protein
LLGDFFLSGRFYVFRKKFFCHGGTGARFILVDQEYFREEKDLKSFATPEASGDAKAQSRCYLFFLVKLD